MAIANVRKYCIEMEIPEISKLESIWSPEILIHGIPWKVKVCKKGQGEQQSLGVFLNCANEAASPNWSLWGQASFKLLPTNENDDANTIEHHTSPYVFDNSGFGHGTGSLIKWNDLFNQDKKFVKDDTIHLEIKVNAENPNDPNRGRLDFERLSKCCETCSCAKFQLKVNNISNLIAVKSRNFTFCGELWNIEICKTRSSYLGVLLRLDENTKKELSKVTMRVKVLSSKEGIQPIEECITKQYKYLTVEITTIVPWDEMVKPENGFVKDNTITLDIEIKPDASDEPNAKRIKLNNGKKSKSLKLECPICLESIDDQELGVTPCGHLFCMACIKESIAGRAVCPKCNKIVRSNCLRQLYLPVVD